VCFWGSICDIAKVAIIHRKILANLVITKENGCKTPFSIFGYPLQPCREIWQLFSIIFFGIVVIGNPKIHFILEFSFFISFFGDILL
jgi:hypothetical protein